MKKISQENVIEQLFNYILYFRRHPLRFSIVISILLTLDTMVVFLTNGSSQVFTHLFYIPIILASYGYGASGGFITGIIAGLLVGPFMPFDVEKDISQSFLSWTFRCIFFAFFGYISGILFYKLRTLKKYYEEIGTSIISSLANAIEARDPYTLGHCHNVEKMSVALAKQLHMSEKELLEIKWSSLIHDIGKIGIPEEILNKPGQLTDEEYSIIKQHPIIGAEIIQPLKNLSVIVPGVKYHHEAMDGTGYPEGLVYEQIPLQARIIAIADVWDALTSDRPYRKGLSHKEAAAIMLNMAGTKLDSKLLTLFIKKVIKIDLEQKQKAKLAN
ncbi:HD-GYP domain-containing protein [Bacillus sp. 03113]|uniref:HD-GYP domain-containing protein n=1 Tax=Bacillus sp. 03113 TaxID=2578211 RepID=UPI0015E895E3|nr:HD-GYP domain-containing protein [Bacillus sp. 03113]